LATEEEIFKIAGVPVIAPELRENFNKNLDEALSLVEVGKKSAQLITLGDMRGVIHTHTTYSDGVNTIAEMVHHAQKKGYAYIGITDHSKSAFYANGLKEDRLFEQWKEIDALNAELFNFKILKGIESDILYEGGLDYSDDILQGFDFVIASVHSQLKMTEEKATARLIKAIENPYTTILGHPTGRLLLARAGYPIDHKKVIDACAANKVAIELNANPYRLDLDWTWIHYAREKNVLVAINPDAHSCSGIDDIIYGIHTARKGGLNVSGCLNTLNVEGFMNFKST
jgi:DNA polymerase (family 10)